jgi:phage tail-like protein
MPVRRDDPYAGYNFQVTVNNVNDGTTVSGSFTEASGLEVMIDPIEYRHGRDDITPRKIPGLKKFTNITLKKGITADLEFWNWILKAMNGEVQRTEGSITLLDENKQAVMKWNFKRGWPAKWTGPGLNETSNEIAMETLEICHEGLEIDGQSAA